MAEALYIKPRIDGTPALSAYAAFDGGLDVFDSRGMRAVSLRGSYINECGGPCEALDEFYRDPESSTEYWAPARAA